MERILRGLVRRAGWIAVVCLGLSLAAVDRIVDLRSGEPRLVLDPSVSSMLPAGDAAQLFYDRARELFGSDDTLLVVLVGADVFSAENLQRLLRLSERLEALDFVHHVSSLATASDIRSVGGELRVEPFLEEVPGSAAGRADLRRRVLASPIHAGNLVSRDGRAAALTVHLLDVSEREFNERGLDEVVADTAREAVGDAELWVTGGPRVKAELGRLLLGDLGLVLPLAIAVMGAVALVAFRTLRGLLIPLGVVCVAVLWSVAAIAVVAGSINQVTVAVPPIVLVVGFAYSVHVVSAYYDVLRSGQAPGDEVGATLAHVWLPVVLTGATTAAGFLSLLTSPLGAIRQFGLFNAVGVVFATLLSLSLAPAWLQLLGPPRRLRAAASGERIDRLLEGLARFDLRRRVPILVFGALVAAVSLVGMARIRVGTDLVRNFRSDNPVRRDFEAVNRQLEGANSFFVVLDADFPGAFREPAQLREIEALQRWLEAQPEVGGTTSLVDYVQVLHRGFRGGEPGALRLPESRELVSQLLLFAPGEELESFVDADYRTANVVVRTPAVDSHPVSALADRIEARLAELPPQLAARVTGDTILVSRTIDDIALGQALSLLTAFGIIYAILALLFTSWWVGLMAMVPNVLPVLVYFGTLGFAGVTLNTTTGLVASLVLGIAVDDTIHFLTQFNRASRRRADESQGVVDAMRSVGRPVTCTTAALCLGFLVLTTSELRNQIEFGVLAAFTLAVAWLIDLSFTPALAARLRTVTLWDVLTLDLGEAPERSIPLFAGLRATQARTAALLASIQRFPKGHRLFRAGDRGDQMYVVIDGKLAASLETGGQVVQFGTLERGDVVGEVALFHGRRTADVEALTDVRLLRLSHAALERVRRRHPRIGARLYRNLSRILADRVATTTAHVR